MFHAHKPDDEQHKHHHNVELKNITNIFIVGVILNLAFVIIEAVYGLLSDSLALLSDAGHNLSDVASLLISILAFKLAEKKPTKIFTFGFSKGTVLAGIINAALLLIAIGSIGYSAVHRFFHPSMVDGSVVSIVAFIGIIVNGVSAYLFARQKQQDVNVRGAYLHLMADALVSLAVVIAGVLISYTNWLWLDPLISLIIMLVILGSTWRLLKSTLRLSLDGVPEDIHFHDIEELKSLSPLIIDLHHIHIWPISSTKNAMTAHILIANNLSVIETEELKILIKTKLKDLKIDHSTLEFEFNSCKLKKEA